MLLLSGFAGATLALALIGLYGVLAYAVALRTREIGIRTALGATRRDIAVLVLGQMLVRVAAGLLIGSAGTAAANRLLRGALFQVSPWDPATFLAAAALIGGAALVTAALPTLRATHIDAVLAIRQE